MIERQNRAITLDWEAIGWISLQNVMSFIKLARLVPLQILSLISIVVDKSMANYPLFGVDNELTASFPLASALKKRLRSIAGGVRASTWLVSPSSMGSSNAPSSFIALGSCASSTAAYKSSKSMRLSDLSIRGPFRLLRAFAVLLVPMA